jgi:protein-disulfide isomerase
MAVFRNALYLGCITLAPMACSAQRICAPLSNAETQRIANFVKSRDSSVQEVRTEAVSVATGQCYRTMIVRRSDAAEQRLLLSPDHRYLSLQVIDTQPEFAAKERARQDVVAAMMANSAKRPEQGPPAAPIKIDVFSDFQCPYCRQEFETVNKTFLGQHASEIKLSFHHTPLPIHDWAHRAAELSECAYDQDQKLFWAAHDFLFETQPSLTAANIDGKVRAELSKSAGFQPSQFDACLARGTRDGWVAIEQDLKLAAALGVASTPTMFINGSEIEGTPQIEQLQTLVKELQPAVSPTPSSPSPRSAGSGSR